MDTTEKAQTITRARRITRRRREVGVSFSLSSSTPMARRKRRGIQQLKQESDLYLLRKRDSMEVERFNLGGGGRRKNDLASAKPGGGMVSTHEDNYCVL